jgi:hypothetical protein
LACAPFERLDEVPFPKALVGEQVVLAKDSDREELADGARRDAAIDE